MPAVATRQNVDLEKLESFRDYLSHNPNKGKLQLEAKALYEGQVGRSTVHIGPYALDGERISVREDVGTRAR